jgi:DivIVA domain-containing protein
VTLVMVLLTIAVVAGVSAVATGMVSGGLAEPASSIPRRALPNGPLTGQDVADLRFVQGFRGYRMDQVDAAMDALGAELDRLRGLLDDPSRPADPTRLDDTSRLDDPTRLQDARLPGGPFEDAPSHPGFSVERD